MLSNSSRLFVIVLLGLTLALAHGGQARAGYVVNVTQSGGDVVAAGSGTIDTTELTFNGGGGFNGGATFNAAQGQALFGDDGLVSFDSYVGISGPSSFGPGGHHESSFGTGDIVGIFGENSSRPLVVPQNYVSGSPLSSSDTWAGATFSSLGLTTGTYVWTWGSGANADSFTLNIGASSVPEPASLVLLGTGSLAILGYSRRRRWASA